MDHRHLGTSLEEGRRHLEETLEEVDKISEEECRLEEICHLEEECLWDEEWVGPTEEDSEEECRQIWAAEEAAEETSMQEEEVWEEVRECRLPEEAVGVGWD